jgi:hypothetical protein
LMMLEWVVAAWASGFAVIEMYRGASRVRTVRKAAIIFFFIEITFCLVRCLAYLRYVINQVSVLLQENELTSRILVRFRINCNLRGNQEIIDNRVFSLWFSID